MEENKPIDGAEYISLQEAKHLKLPYFEGAAAGSPSPASDYQHESLVAKAKRACSKTASSMTSGVRAI